MMKQDDIFLSEEGNRWFRRNRASLTAGRAMKGDHILNLIRESNITPRKVLEVGAGNGYRLHELSTELNCECTAVEPSVEAIECGKVHYPKISFVHGIASDLPFEDGFFDCIIVNFVFHWIDRQTLMQSAAEVDRVLSDGGYLVIGDFYPAHPEKKRYHHIPEGKVWTYKQDYSNIFISTNIYESLLRRTYDHDESRTGVMMDIEPSKRASVVLLRKSLNGRYADSVQV